MSTRSSLFYSFLDRYASLAISVVSTMVLARLLTPADIGVFSVTMVLLMFLSTVRDLGAGQYLVQEKELTIERIQAVWAVQLGLGLGFSVLILLFSYPVSVFYREPRMLDIMLVVAMNFAINPFGSLTYAWNMREMRYDVIALIRFSATVVSAIVSGVLAWKDFGPISLALGSLAATVVTALLSIAFRPAHFPWLPSFKGVRRVIKFGSQMTATNFLNTFTDGAPELLLGKFQGMAVTGLYSRAHGLVGMIGRLLIEASYSVAISTFAKHSREKNNFSSEFMKAQAYITALAWPACAFLLLLAQPITRLLYGPQWNESVDLTRLLAIAAMCHGVCSICHAALIASGNVTKILKLTIFSTVLSVTVLLIAIFYGKIEAIGVAFIISSFAITAVTLIITKSAVGYQAHDLIRIAFDSLKITVAASIGPLVVMLITGFAPQGFVHAVVLSGASSFLGWLIAIWLLNHSLYQEVRFLSRKIMHRFN